MNVKSVMTQFDLSLSPWNTIREAAAIMRDKDVAALPIKSDDSPLGLVIDRDIIVRLLPEARDAGSRPVKDVMISHPATCLADQDVVEAAVIMSDEQVRHLLVMDRSGRLVGVLSVDDIARNASEELAGQTLGEIVEQRAEPSRGPCVRRPR